VMSHVCRCRAVFRYVIYVGRLNVETCTVVQVTGTVKYKYKYQLLSGIFPW
jgi:hypothetical protein